MKKTTKWNIFVCAVLFGLFSGLVFAVNMNSLLKSRLRRVEENNALLRTEVTQSRQTDSLIVELVREELRRGGNLNSLLDNLEEIVVSQN